MSSIFSLAENQQGIDGFDELRIFDKLKQNAHW